MVAAEIEATTRGLQRVPMTSLQSSPGATGRNQGFILTRESFLDLLIILIIYNTHFNPLSIS